MVLRTARWKVEYPALFSHYKFDSMLHCRSPKGKGMSCVSCVTCLLIIYSSYFTTPNCISVYQNTKMIVICTRTSCTDMTPALRVMHRNIALNVNCVLMVSVLCSLQLVSCVLINEDTLHLLSKTVCSSTLTEINRLQVQGEQQSAILSSYYYCFAAKKGFSLFLMAFRLGSDESVIFKSVTFLLKFPIFIV